MTEIVYQILPMTDEVVCHFNRYQTMHGIARSGQAAVVDPSQDSCAGLSQVDTDFALSLVLSANIQSELDSNLQSVLSRFEE